MKTPAEKLVDDMMPEEPGPNWKCPRCGAEFKSEKVFNNHVKFCTGE